MNSKWFTTLMDDKVFIFFCIGILFSEVIVGWVGTAFFYIMLGIAGIRYYQVYTGERQLDDN